MTEFHFKDRSILGPSPCSGHCSTLPAGAAGAAGAEEEDESVEGFLQEKLMLLQKDEERWARPGELQQLRLPFPSVRAALFSRLPRSGLQRISKSTRRRTM